METRGERLRRLRKQLNMTVTELAKATHCSRALITRMEAEERGRSADKYPAIAKALGCRIDDLFPEMDGYIPPTEEPQSVHDSPAQPEDSHNAAPAADADVPARPNDVVPPIQGKPTTAALDADNWWELLGLEL